jgi:hypothetical protein
MSPPKPTTCRRSGRRSATRYRISTLLIVTTILAGFLAMFVQYGPLGVPFFLPHAVVIGLCVGLARRRRRIAAGIIAATYAVCWLLTGVWGVPSTCGEIESQLKGESETHTPRLPIPTRIAYSSPLDNPFSDWSIPDDEPPWYYVGGESAPCPFVVTLEYGYMNEFHSGFGGQIYYFWIVGYRLGTLESFSWTAN